MVRREQVNTVLVVVVAVTLGLTGNIAAGTLPSSFQPWLWVAWPVTVVLTIVTVVLELRKRRSEDTETAAPRNGVGLDQALAMLTSGSPAERSAGLRAFGQWADSGSESAQWYVDVLCDQARGLSRAGDEGQHATRQVIFDIIRARLQPESSSGWHGCTFNLSGVVLDGCSLDGAALDGGHVILTGATFTASPAGRPGGLSWRGGSFRRSLLEVTDATVTANGVLDLSAGLVDDSRLDLSRVSMTAGRIVLRGMKVRTSPDPHLRPVIDLTRTKLAGGEVDFTGSVFGDRRRLEELRGAPVNEPPVKPFTLPYQFWVALSFEYAELTGATVQFRQAVLVDGYAVFDRSVIDGSHLDFPLTSFYEGSATFYWATLRSGTVDFSGTHLWRGVALDEQGTPPFIATVRRLLIDRVGGTDYTHLGLPDAALVFVEARLEGGAITFEGVDAAAGTLIDFNHAHLAGTKVLVSDSDLKDSLLVLWHLHVEDGDGNFTVLDSDPEVLLSDNMGAGERARVELPSVALPLEISDRD